MAIVLLTHFSGANASTTILDEVGHAITPVGNAQISTTESKFGASSLLLDGNGDYLSLADSADWDLAGDFTIECWVRLSSANLTGTFNPCFMSATTVAGGSDRWYFHYDVSVNRVIFGNTTIGDIASSAGPLTLNTWQHICVVRSGTSVKVAIDGTFGSPGTNSSTHTADALFIGALRSTGGYLNGYIDEIRINNGEALYTANFTVPSQQFFYQSTVLLLHANGANGSTTIKDEAGHAVTASGNAQLSTAQYKFGGSSILFDGSGDYLSLASSSDFGFGSSDFTVDMWVYHASGTGSQQLIGQRTTNINSGIYLFLQGGNVYLYLGDGSSWFVNGITAAHPTGSWFHLAITRNNTTVRIFINGSLVTTATSVTGILPSSAALYIGYEAYQNSVFFNGYLDEIRVCKSAKYTATFTPQDAPHDYEYTVLLLHNDGANNATCVIEETGKAITTNGNAKLSTTQAKIGTTSTYFDGTGDYLSLISHAGLATGSQDITVECWLYVDPAVAMWARPIENVEFDSATKGWHLSFNGSDSAGSRRLGVQLSNLGGGGSRIDSNAAFPTNQWVHVAFVRHDNTGYLYINGVQQTATLNLSGYSFGSQALRIGASLGTASNYYTGYIDELRISKGIARYTTNFTPPIIPFTLLGQYIYVISGTVQSDAGVLTSRVVRLYRRDTGSLISETTSDGTSGAFVFSNISPMEYYLVCLDDAAGTQYNSLIQDRITPT